MPQPPKLTTQHAVLFMDCLRGMVLNNRFASGSTDTPYSILEIFVVQYVVAGVATTIKELQPLVGFTAGALSRVVSRLVRDGHLTREVNPDDGRSAILAATDKARKIIVDSNKPYDPRAAAMFERVPRKEREELYQALSDIGANHGVADAPHFADEHESRRFVRRFTVGIGFLGNDLLGSGLISTHWMLFELVANLPQEACTPAHLGEVLGLPAPTISYGIKVLQRQKLFTKAVDPEDQRSYTLRLSEEGQAFREEKIEYVRGFLEQSFVGYSLEQVDKVLESFELSIAPLRLEEMKGFEQYMQIEDLSAEAQEVVPEKPHLEKVAKVPAHDIKTRASTKKLVTQFPRPKVAGLPVLTLLSVELVVADSGELRNLGRRFLFQQLLDSDLVDFTPTCILSEDCFVTLAMSDEEVFGLFQISAAEQDPPVLLVIDGLIPSLAQSFLTESLSYFKMLGGEFELDGSELLTNVEIPLSSA